MKTNEKYINENVKENIWKTNENMKAIIKKAMKKWKQKKTILKYEYE